MRPIILAGSALAALALGSGSAMAQPAWSGVYLGVNAGGAWGQSDVTSTTDAGTYFAGSSVTSINGNGTADLSPNGFTGGAQLGWNWQSGNVVFGLEGDFNAMDLSEGRTVTAGYPCCAPSTYTLNQEVSTDWLATLRPRVGMTAGNWLLYGTGGLAVTEVNLNESFTDNFGAAPHALENGSVSETRYGWTLGAGAEVDLGNSWSIKGEYLYADFGDVDSTGALTAPTGTATFTHNADLNANIFRVGVNRRF
jgi:outer membrane immunogenic protein